MPMLLHAGLALAFLLIPLDPTIGAAEPLPQAAADQSKTEELKDQVAAMEPGSSVVVQLLNKEKIQGKIGAVSGEGFEVQVSEGEPVQIAFSDVESFGPDWAEKVRAYRKYAIVGLVVFTLIVIFLSNASSPFM